MGRRFKQTFLQRRHTDDQKAHEKMLNIINYQRNANKKMRFHLVAFRMAIIKKNLQIINAADGVEKREPSYTVGKNINWCSHYGKLYADSFKT